jgi:hypothetical protein
MKSKKYFLILLTLWFAFIGCSSSDKRNRFVEYVEGIVTMDGTPLDNASIQFIPKTEGKGESAGGYTNANGKYTLSSLNGNPGKGALAGEYIVLISKTISVPISRAKYEEGEAPPEELKQLVPAVYQNRNKPFFEVTVVKGKNVHNFEVKSKP